MFFSRKDPIKEISLETATAIGQACHELKKHYPIEELFGFALCTDDDLRTLFHVVCTRQWVREREADYPGIGFIYVEWQDSSSDHLFEQLGRRFAAHADKSYRSDAESADARDQRFEALVRALKSCREKGLFAEDTLLCVGSTDPSEQLEALAMGAVDRLNIRRIADQFADHLGYEKYRK